MNMSVCLESGQPCDPIIPVFVNTVLPKEVCNRNQDFRDKGQMHIHVYVLLYPKTL